MALQAKQTVQQRLLLAPSVTLALEVLRMPLMELRAYLEQQCEENPLLELEDESTSEAEFSPEETATNGTEQTNEPEELDEALIANWQATTETESPDNEDRARERILEQCVAAPQSLQDALLLQLGCQQLSKDQQRLGELLIGHIDDSGYLASSLEEIATGAGVTVAQLEPMLRIVQEFDPPGVGARDLRECLMLQLEQRQACGQLAYRILQDHFALFVEQRAHVLAKTYRTTVDEIVKVFDCLKALNPKPGRAYSSDLPPTIVPDLLVHHREKHYDVELNDPALPHITINRTYYRMLKDGSTPSDAKEFLSNKFRRASWLIKAIDERNATLLSIARCLISLQREFLEQGPRAITPLTQAQVASLIGRHPSTISRAIAGKTIDTPYGLFRLEQLFASSVPQVTSTASVSDEKVKAEIQRLIDEEDPRHPLSDEALVKRLGQRNISVARRTIAKYRTAVRILPAHLRKRRF